MSLWEKWEKEKMEKMGLKVERPDSVEIYDMRPKADPWKQAGIIFGVFFFCCVAFVAAMYFSGSRWSDTYIVRIFVNQDKVRKIQSENLNSTRQ